MLQRQRWRRWDTDERRRRCGIQMSGGSGDGGGIDFRQREMLSARNTTLNRPTQSIGGWVPHRQMVGNGEIDQLHPPSLEAATPPCSVRQSVKWYAITLYLFKYSNNCFTR
jgi:hypothetical protein